MVPYGRVGPCMAGRREGRAKVSRFGIQNKPYVYRSTSIYDKTTKSPKKVSTYLGRLTQEEGLIPKGPRRSSGMSSSDSSLSTCIA